MRTKLMLNYRLLSKPKEQCLVKYKDIEYRVPSYIVYLLILRRGERIIFDHTVNAMVLVCG
jgi:hypothetical protein